MIISTVYNRWLSQLFTIERNCQASHGGFVVLTKSPQLINIRYLFKYNVYLSVMYVNNIISNINVDYVKWAHLKISSVILSANINNDYNTNGYNTYY